MSSDSLMSRRPLSHTELVAAMIIFVLPPVLYGLIAAGLLPPGLFGKSGVNYLLLVGLGLLLPVGLAIAKGWPRWAYSYLGMVLLIAAMALGYDRVWAAKLFPQFIDAFGPRSAWGVGVRLAYRGLFAFVLPLTILLASVVLVGLLGLLPFTRPVWQRMRSDWTQLSLVSYGYLVVGIYMTFDDYGYDEGWQLAARILLALGAWAYLRASTLKGRIWALIGGSGAALAVVALGKWLIIPLQKWPTGYPVSPSEATRVVVTVDALVWWVYLVVVMLLPALLKLLPLSATSDVPAEKDTVTA